MTQMDISTANINLFVLTLYSLQIAVFGGLTHISVKGHYLLGYELGANFTSDWFGCTEACYKHTQCISYNFNIRNNVCQLNKGGIRSSFVTDRTLSVNKDYIFHQLKTPEDHQQARPRTPQCLCNCGSTQSCYKKPAPGLGDSIHNLGASCKEILNQRSGAKNGPYYLATFPTSAHVYCHMTELPGCGGGGWTLVMKIDGSKSTFRYNSTLWTSDTQHKIQNGKDLTERETCLPTYRSTRFTKLCFGMKYNGSTRWISVSHQASSLKEVLIDGSPVYTNLDAMTWRSLLPDSSLQMNCTKQGFNLRDNALARIGIIGYLNPYCEPSTSYSRLGFGTGGSFYGMEDANTCGNEARSISDNGDKSIMAFGYILVQ